GGTPLMLCTLLGTSVLIRTLGGDYLRNPWNCFVTVIPYGTMLFLTWAMLNGSVWALPLSTALTTYLAQTHVQYVALAAPLLVVGAGALVVRHRSSLRPVAIAG